MRTQRPHVVAGRHHVDGEANAAVHGEEVALRFDEPTGTWMFVCVHSTVLGPGMGGTRMKPYPTPHDALFKEKERYLALRTKNMIVR